MRFDQRTGQFAQGNVGFSGHDLDQKQHMRRKLACGAGGATLRLGRDAPLVAKRRRKPDCRARTDPEHAGRSPTGMPRRNVVKHTLSQIHRICFAHETPPVGSESLIQTYGNPPRFRSNANCFNPIEMAFAKLKALPRKAAVRTYDDLWKAVGTVCDLFTEEECLNYFIAAGYKPN